MKILNKKLLVLLFLGMGMACNNFDLNLQDNPNAITPDKASLNDLYNSIQLEFGSVYLDAEHEAGAAARMYMRVAFTYRAATPANSGAMNALWSDAYSGLFPDIDALMGLAQGKGFDIHVGTAKIMKAYTLMVLVDIFGDVPLTQAGQGSDVISPAVDSGSDVYNAAIGLLDEGITDLTGTTAAKPTFDNFYNGDPDKWIRFAKTLKYRAAINMNDATTADALYADIINTNNGDDFRIQFGSQRLNPDSRDPYYANHYESGDGDYLSNYYMWLLRAEKQDLSGNSFKDPRLRYYFYRKVDDAVNQDQTTYSCHFSALPDQAFQPAVFAAVDPRLPYCVASADGYSGRDHLNGEGIPPDGPIRTSYGLYPFGGDFDDDSFKDTRQSGTTGGLGAGIAPIFMASFGDLMQAEAILRLSATGGGGDARALLKSGMEESLDKVESFEDLVSSKMNTSVTLKSGASGTIKDLFGMSPASKASYVTKVLAKYDAATSNTEKLDIVVKEMYIAAWGNGLEAYNLYRRTGMPSNLEPALEPPGPFPLSFFYPSNSVTRNASIKQKDEMNVPVFWQDGSVSSGLY